MGETFIRDADVDDFAAISTIAEAGDSAADEPYLTFVASTGALRVTVANDTIVAFGGIVGIGDDVTMVTDLFVAPDGQGGGLGGALLADLLRGAGQRMTFSSKHPAAVPAYARAGMVPAWRLLY